MKQIKRLSILCCLLALGLSHAFAQGKGENLLKGGNLENGKTPGENGFNYTYYNQISTKQAQEGEKSLEIYGNGGFLYIGNHDPSEGLVLEIPVTGGETYVFSYWHYGAKNDYAFTPVAQWLDADQKQVKLGFLYDARAVVKEENVWKKSQAEVPAPDNARFVRLRMQVNSDRGGYFLDNFYFGTKEATQPKVEQPQSITTTAFQREVELKWANAEGTTWEITVGGKTIATTQPNLILEGLEPATSYAIEVVAIKDQVKSEAQTVKVQTAALSYAADDENRVPYLRTVSEGADSPKVLPLYFNELNNGKASITYMLDGENIQPTNGRLQLQTGEHQLTVHIQEDSTHEWTLHYILNVQ